MVGYPHEALTLCTVFAHLFVCIILEQLHTVFPSDLVIHSSSIDRTAYTTAFSCIQSDSSGFTYIHIYIYINKKGLNNNFPSQQVFRPYQANEKTRTQFEVRKLNFTSRDFTIRRFLSCNVLKNEAQLLPSIRLAGSVRRVTIKP